MFLDFNNCLDFSVQLIRTQRWPMALWVLVLYYSLYLYYYIDETMLYEIPPIKVLDFSQLTYS